MARYDPARALAQRLIADFGQEVTLQRIVDGSPPDTDQPWNPGAPTTTSYTVNAVFLDYDIRYIDGSLIQQGDQRVLIAAQGLAVTPTLKDVIVRDTVEMSIVNIKPLKPGSQEVLFELQVRQ